MSTFNVNALSMSMKARTYAAIRNIDLLNYRRVFVGRKGRGISNPLLRTFGEQSTLALTAMGGSGFA
jgi:hypothetical protein